ncbi:MAG: hypothetical protein Q8K91_11985, partial [Hylemonella sp.]|nr:hypothetical protein [Hylemonella sp.]
EVFRFLVVSQQAVDQFVRDGHLVAIPWECSSFLPIDRLHKSFYTPPAKFANGCAEVSNQLNGFSYPDLLNRISDIKALKSLYGASTNGYEKLQVFRLLGLDVGNSVIQKFINESYHIENEFICQLDPAKFDTIPEYVIAECDKLLTQAEG